ncbi:unnamed protein product [Paramecium sonneborni]|uniref:Uncharacterized protein n=1 Tax=Paramecium sonneborni TaxID=65129 RepID=A0A8S1P8V4_9CILI|nr:unnamed protein product [Paramecium sonneborni]
MLSSIEYQRFTQTQLSEDQSNFDTTKLIHRVLEMSKLEKFTCTIQNLRLNTQNQLQLNSLYSNKHFKLNHEYIQFPLLKSQIISRTLSNHKLIMKQTNKLHKSHSQIEALQFPSKFTKIRRKSGCEILSDKQVRLATLYPNTYIAFHQLQKQNKRNEMRKKTIFKRMSSILIKHSNNIKSQTSNRLSQQIIQDEIPTKLDEQSSKIILKQFQQQIGCFKEIQDLFSNMEIHKNYNYYKKNQKNILSLQIILLLLTEISKNNQQKEILSNKKLYQMQVRKNEKHLPLFKIILMDIHKLTKLNQLVLYRNKFIFNIKIYKALQKQKLHRLSKQPKLFLILLISNLYQICLIQKKHKLIDKIIIDSIRQLKKPKMCIYLVLQKRNKFQIKQSSDCSLYQLTFFDISQFYYYNILRLSINIGLCLQNS